MILNHETYLSKKVGTNAPISSCGTSCPIALTSCRVSPLLLPPERCSLMQSCLPPENTATPSGWRGPTMPLRTAQPKPPRSQTPSPSQRPPPAPYSSPTVSNHVRHLPIRCQCLIKRCNYYYVLGQKYLSDNQPRKESDAEKSNPFSEAVCMSVEA